MKQKQTPSQANSRTVAASFVALSLEPGEQRTNRHVFHEFARENDSTREWAISRYPRPPPEPE